RYPVVGRHRGLNCTSAPSRELRCTLLAPSQKELFGQTVLSRYAWGTHTAPRFRGLTSGHRSDEESPCLRAPPDRLDQHESTTREEFLFITTGFSVRDAKANQ